MQERYLGDSHDFIKYALLTHLHSELQLRLGVNWYLARPENVDRPANKDGEKRHHLKGGVWRSLNSDLFEKIVRFADPGERYLSRVGEWEVLPAGTLFHSEYICSDDRNVWHRNALAALAQSDLVFLDPDNGFEITSMTRRTSPKYALFREAEDFLRLGKAVIGIQFARQCDPVARAHEVRERLMSACGSDHRLPVVRGRLAPNILFITVAPPSVAQRFGSALERFCNQSEKVDLIA
ncbi:MAG: hypothetical protein H0W74_03165 [Sphingosinicella sp.]|nr:hypothetical protein [Sphingosinicella sp.]